MNYKEKIKENKESINIFKNIIVNYVDLFADNPKQKVISWIMKTYKFDKPLTSIEIYDKNRKDVKKFTKALQRFFFVKQFQSWKDKLNPKFNGEIIISRFKTINEVAVRCKGLSDKKADIAGLFFGYEPKNIANYCLAIRNRFDLIKIEDDEIEKQNSS